MILFFKLFCPPEISEDSIGLDPNPMQEHLTFTNIGEMNNNNTRFLPMWMLNGQDFTIILTLKMIFNVSTPFQPGKHEQYEQSWNLWERSALTKHKPDKVIPPSLPKKICLLYIFNIFEISSAEHELSFNSFTWFCSHNPAEPRLANVPIAFESSPTWGTTLTSNICRWTNPYPPSIGGSLTQVTSTNCWWPLPC